MRARRSYWLVSILLGLLAFVVVLFSVISLRSFRSSEFPPTRYGITFSTQYAKQLGMEPLEAYRTLVEDLGVRTVRLPLYWSSIESVAGQFDWELVDQLVSYSENNQVALTLVVGMKVPRWPECYIPDWAEGLDAEDQQKVLLSWMQKAVERYKDVSVLERWQVDNEPFFPFGICPQISQAQFQERVDLVRRLDPQHPIQITVSGEGNSWNFESKSADILGFSLYRLTWNDLFGFFMYPLTPEFYYLRAQVARKNVEQVLVSELQAEPWFPEPLSHRSPEKWYEAFDAIMFQQNLQFVEKAHISEVYLWGAEWWLYLKQQGDERLWNVAKEVFTQS